MRRLSYRRFTLCPGSDLFGHAQKSAHPFASYLLITIVHWCGILNSSGPQCFFPVLRFGLEQGGFNGEAA